MNSLNQISHLFFQLLGPLSNPFKNPSKLEIYTDGSYKDGLGSWAYLISRDGECITENSGRVRRVGNNAMEIQAAIEALRRVPPNSDIILFSDSRILIDAMKYGNGPLAYQARFEVLNRLAESHRIHWRWIKGHRGNKFNERCDELCSLARK